jgi:hypothetical protein
MKSSSTIAWTFSVLFLVLALLGFISDSLPVDSAFFETNTILNFTHLITAVGFAFVAKENVDESIHHIQVFGVAYMMISGIGFMGMNIQIGEPWSYTLYLNFLNYVQFGLGIILCISGSSLKKRRRLILA